MISIISLLALIMYSHVVVSQYMLETVRSHAGGSAVGEASFKKILSYDTTKIGTIDQGECLQVRDDKDGIIVNIELHGLKWKARRAIFNDRTAEDDLHRKGYPHPHRSVWSATPREGGECSDGEYMYEEPLIGHAKKREPGRRERSAVTAADLEKPKISKKKKISKAWKKVKRKESEPKPMPVIEIPDWQFEPDESGKKTLYHHDLSQSVKEEIHSFKSGECIVIQFKETPDYEFEVYCLKENGKWADRHDNEYDDDGISSYLERYDDDDEFELWFKKIDGAKEVKERVWPKETGAAAADAYVEYEDEMDGFASKYDELLAQFEYDVEVEEAREKKAMTHLAKEQYHILRAKNRKNKYWSSSSS